MIQSSHLLCWAENPYSDYTHPCLIHKMGRTHGRAGLCHLLQYTLAHSTISTWANPQGWEMPRLAFLPSLSHSDLMFPMYTLGLRSHPPAL